MQPLGPLVLRVFVGVIFVAHGAQKLFGVWGGGGIEGTAGYFAQLGLNPAMPLAVAVGVTEFAGGILLIVGALTVPVSAALAISMLVAIWKVHYPNGFFMGPADGGLGYEFNFALIGALLSLMLTGSGAASIDGHRTRSAETRAAGRARIRFGKV